MEKSFSRNSLSRNSVSLLSTSQLLSLQSPRWQSPSSPTPTTQLPLDNVEITRPYPTFRVGEDPIAHWSGQGYVANAQDEDTNPSKPNRPPLEQMDSTTPPLQVAEDSKRDEHGFEYANFEKLGEFCLDNGGKLLVKKEEHFMRNEEILMINEGGNPNFRENYEWEDEIIEITRPTVVAAPPSFSGDKELETIVEEGVERDLFLKSGPQLVSNQIQNRCDDKSYNSKETPCIDSLEVGDKRGGKSSNDLENKGHLADQVQERSQNVEGIGCYFQDNQKRETLNISEWVSGESSTHGDEFLNGEKKVKKMMHVQVVFGVIGWSPKEETK